jgi:SAM-dependent methyltransferase
MSGADPFHLVQDWNQRTSKEFNVTDYWKSFWLSHSQKNQYKDPQIQVVRTLNKEPVQPEIFAAMVESIITMIRPASDLDLLDLCCGNGLITNELIGRFGSITAVDLCEVFISQLDDTGINSIVSDVRTVEFPRNSFDRILLYSGLQYFSDKDAVNLFHRLKQWLRSGGVVVIGDIPDSTRRWNFFNTPVREEAYFEALSQDEPILGHWFDPAWLRKLARHSGFASAEVVPQPAIFPFQHYRYDLVLAMGT